VEQLRRGYGQNNPLHSLSSGVVSAEARPSSQKATRLHLQACSPAVAPLEVNRGRKINL